MSSLQAAMGASQVSEISARLEIKRNIADKYSAAFKDIDNLTLPVPHTEAGRNGYWAYTLVLKDDYSNHAKGFCNKLSEKGIGTRSLFFQFISNQFIKMKKRIVKSILFQKVCIKRAFTSHVALGLPPWNRSML